MRKTVSKFLAAVMAAAIVVTMAPVDAQAAITAPKEVVTYLAPNSTTSNSFSIEGVKKSSKITDASSSNASVVKPLYYEKGGWEYTSLSKDYKPYNSSPSLYLGYRINKLGSATLSYKVDGKSLSTKITALKYTNPLKSFQIAGGANVASKFNNTTYVTTKKLAAAKKNAKVTVKAASGWKITGVYFYRYDKKGYSSDSYNYYSNSGTGSATLYVGNLAKGRYQVSINAKNTKTGGSVYLSYNMYQ